jgi:hypothetical protein
MVVQSKYLFFDEQLNGDLRLTLTDEGEKELITLLKNSPNNYPLIWSELLTETAKNGSFALVHPSQVGALTISIIITNELIIDDEGIVIRQPNTKYWWSPDYMVVDELNELLTNKKFIFKKAI